MAGDPAQVVVVDDDPEIRFILALQLRKQGWEVTELNSGEDLLRGWDGSGYDAVVLDQRMAGLTGLEVARQLREDGYQRPVIVFSAYVDADLRRDAEQLEVGVIPKSEVTDVVEALRTVLKPRRFRFR